MAFVGVGDFWELVMAFVEGIGRSFMLLLESVKVFLKYPRLLLPLLLPWGYVAGTVYWYFSIAGGASDLFIGLVIIGFSMITVFANSLLLEMMQHIENGKNPSLLKAFRDTITLNFIQFLPLSVLWVFSWFVLTAVQALRGREINPYEDEDEKEGFDHYGKPTPEELPSRMDKVMRRGIRMAIFFVPASIAWEGKKLFPAVRRSMDILSNHIEALAEEYFGTTFLAATLVFFPLLVVIVEVGLQRLDFDTLGWMGLTLYVGLAWSYVAYVEQMFTGQLFLWNTKLENTARMMRERGDEAPDLESMNVPSLLDSVSVFSDRVDPQYREYDSLQKWVSNMAEKERFHDNQ